MKQSTIIWTLILALSGLYLAWRASSGEMGRAYVRVEQVQPVGPEGEELPGWEVRTTVDPKLQNEENVRFSWSRTIGLWVAALCTLAIFSFLWGDNPLYKLAEAVFVGSSAGYAMAVGFWDGIINTLMRNLSPELMRRTVLPGISAEETANWYFLIPLALGIAMLWRLSPVGGWISRWPLAFFIGATAGLRLVAYFQSDFMIQIQSTILPVLVVAADRQVDVSASLRNVTILIGVLSSLVYFFFSVEHTGPVGHVARLGVWFLMITFGAGFGYTVMGRIALLSGRLEFLFDDWLWLIDPLKRRVMEM